MDPEQGALILADLKAAIKAANKAGRTGKARTGEGAQTAEEARREQGEVGLG